MKNLLKYNVFTMVFQWFTQWFDTITADVRKSGTEMQFPETYINIDARSCVVYNKFNIDSTLAAAVLKTQEFVGMVIDNTKVIPSNFENYIWLGINPNLTPEGAFTNILDKKHQVYMPVKDTTLDDDYTRSVFEVICDQLVLPTCGLGIAINKFYTNELTHEESVRLYANSIHAFDVINGNTKGPFSVLPYNERQEAAFKLYLTGVKTKLKDGYGIQYVQLSDDKFVKTAVTCFNDDCFWALRLVKLAHKYYANIAVTLNGTLVETNLGDFKNIVMDSKIHNAQTL